MEKLSAKAFRSAKTRSVNTVDKPKSEHREEKLQIALSTYIRGKYPDVAFTAESSGLRLGMSLAKRAKAQRSVHTLPDMIILEPRGGFCGVVLELKDITTIKKWYEKSKVRKENASYSQEYIHTIMESYTSIDQHGKAQADTLRSLAAKGYFAAFACGIEQGMAIMDWYMKLPPTPPPTEIPPITLTKSEIRAFESVIRYS
jgi:hypothetical protein